MGALVLTLLAGMGCATAAPSPQAQRIIPVNGVPGPRCENLGTVIGQSEARSSGATAEELASQAMGEAMGRAAALGATHIFPSPVTVRQKEGAPFSATLTGVAFRCPPASP